MVQGLGFQRPTVLCNGTIGFFRISTACPRASRDWPGLSRDFQSCTAVLSYNVLLAIGSLVVRFGDLFSGT